MANKSPMLHPENLTHEPGEEARRRGSAGGKKRAKNYNERKSLRETATQLLMLPTEGAMQEVMEEMGIKKGDQNYQTAVVVQLIRRALKGDVQATKLIAELMGESGKVSVDVNAQMDVNTIDIEWPAINIPANGRDKDTRNQLAPQPGPQTQFMTSDADIVIYGGSAGGGKTYALLLEGLRHKDVPGFGSVIFRKQYNQIESEGGLWDASNKVYSKVKDAAPLRSPKYHWRFGNTSKLTFAHLATEEDLQGWMGSEIAFIGFDELTHFTRHQFFYMLSRNRSTCGVKPYVRATCNPDSDSWVAKFIQWWWNPETGYAIPERSGVIRWMVMLDDVIHWGDSPQELVERLPGVEEWMCKSVTFILSSIYDNKILMENDPGYLANLNALPEIDKERLLNGNWKIRPAAGLYFNRNHFDMYSVEPEDIVAVCRAWDFAATSAEENEDADRTASALIGKRKDGTYILLDIMNRMVKAGDVEKLLLKTAKADREKYGNKLMIHLPQDPGAAGKIVAKQYVKILSGFNVVAEPVTGTKVNRATPFSAQVQQGNVACLMAQWNDEYFTQAESFPDSKHDDMVDATSDAFNMLANETFNLRNMI